MYLPDLGITNYARYKNNQLQTYHKPEQLLQDKHTLYLEETTYDNCMLKCKKEKPTT